MAAAVASSHKVQLAVEVAFARTMEALAIDLATYLAAGVHHPVENGRAAVSRLLERMVERPLDAYFEEFHLSRAEADEAMSRTLDCIGRSILLIRAAALPSS